jgi:hypothetical protein
MNRGALSPDRMLRPEGSGLNRNGDRRIPVHAFGGRTPGGTPFSTLSPLRNLKAFAERDRLALLLAEVFSDMCQKTIGGGWGRPDPFEFGEYAEELDRVERITLAGLIEAGIGLDLDERLVDAFGPDLGSVLAHKLGWLEISFPVYLEREWTFDLGGRMHVPLPYLVCSAVDYDRLGAETQKRLRVALDQVELREAFRFAYRSFTDRVMGLEGLTLEALLASLRAAGALSADSARPVAELLKNGARAALELAREFGPDAAGCLDPREWVIRHFDVEIPAPRAVQSERLAHAGEIDSDGPVPYDSALGLHLGRLEAGAFDHRRPGGSWHRYLNSPFEREGHISQTRERHLGAFLHEQFLGRP